MTRKRCNDVYMVDGCNDHRFGCSGGCHRRSEPGRSAAGGGVAGREAQPRRGPRVVPVEGRPAVMQEVSIASCRKGLDGESTPALLVQAETSRARSRHWRQHRSGSARASRSNATKRPSWRWRACSPGREGCKIFDLRVAICVRGKDARGSGVARCATYGVGRLREAWRIFEIVYEQQQTPASSAVSTSGRWRTVRAMPNNAAARRPKGATMRTRPAACFAFLIGSTHMPVAPVISPASPAPPPESS